MTAGMRTRRQQLVALLEERHYTFDELRQALGFSVRVLEDDLRHVHRSMRASAQRLEVDPARCEKCGFVFRGREPRHFHRPSRCPRCHSERIQESALRVG